MTEPLTLEQLREMDGNPVWVENKSNPYLNGWGIMLENICSAYHGIFDVEEYGKTWLAYAYPPVHIDREAWTAEWEKHFGYTECSKCEYWYESEEDEDEGDRSAFCPGCGRAMTEEAWQELEKKVKGENNGKI